MKKDGIDINFDISKHFTSMLRIILVVSIFCLIFGFVLSTEVHTEGNQLTITAHKAGEAVGNLLFNVFLMLVGIIMILLGVSVCKEAKQELREWRKINEKTNE